MIIEKVLYKKTFNLGNYSTHTIGIEIGLDPGEDAKEALKTAHDLAHEYHRETFDNGLDHQHIEIRTIQDIQVGGNETSLDELIYKSPDLQALKSFTIIAKGNLTLWEVYNKRLKELSE